MLYEVITGEAGAVYFNNVVSDIRLGENAVLHHVVMQDESTAAYHVGANYVSVARAGNYGNHYIGLGSSILRNGIHGVLSGEGAHCTMNGTFVPGGTQHMDHFTRNNFV